MALCWPLGFKITLGDGDGSESDSDLSCDFERDLDLDRERVDERREDLRRSDDFRDFLRFADLDLSGPFGEAERAFSVRVRRATLDLDRESVILASASADTFSFNTRHSLLYGALQFESRHTLRSWKFALPQMEHSHSDLYLLVFGSAFFCLRFWTSCRSVDTVFFRWLSQSRDHEYELLFQPLWR